MLQAMLLAGLVAAPLGSPALFVPIRRHARRAGTWSAIRRLVLAVLGTVTAHGILALHFSPRRVKDDPAGILREIRQAIGKGLERPPLPIKGLPPDG